MVTLTAIRELHIGSCLGYSLKIYIPVIPQKHVDIIHCLSPMLCVTSVIHTSPICILPDMHYALPLNVCATSLCTQLGDHTLIFNVLTQTATFHVHVKTMQAKASHWSTLKLTYSHSWDKATTLERTNIAYVTVSLLNDKIEVN